MDQIQAGQLQNPQMIKLKEEIKKRKKAEFQIRDDDMIVKGQRMCVPEWRAEERHYGRSTFICLCYASK